MCIKTFTWRLLTGQELTEVYLNEMRRDFPAGELKPLSMILTSEADGTAHTWGVFDGDTLAAYLLMVRPEGCRVSQLDYFAVVPTYRAHGIGAQLLAQLPAGGINVAAQASADRGGNTQTLQLLLECADASAGLIRALHHVVQGYQVHVARHALQLFRDQLRLPVVVVDAVDHGILKADAPPGLLEVSVAGGKQRLYIIRPVHRHNAAAGLAVRCVKGDRQR